MRYVPRLPERLRWISRLAESWRRHELLVHAAAISYTTLLSFFPLLIGLVALTSQWIEQNRAQRAIARALTPYLPPGVLSLVTGAVDAAIQARGVAGIIGVVGLLWAASAAASMVRHSLNNVLGAPTVRSFWRRKGVELAMVGLAGVLISLSLITSAVLEFLSSIPALRAAAALLRESRAFGWSTGVGPWLFSGAAFVIVYRYLPNVRVPRKALLAGGVTAMVLFEVTKRTFFWYVTHLGQYPIVYSHLAGVVIFMVWVYLSALVLLLGAEVMILVGGSDRGSDARSSG
jgi:membrane protein